MIPYVPPLYFAFQGERLLGQYHSLRPMITDLMFVYADLLALDNIVIKDRNNNIVHIIKSRPQRVNSNNSNQWASTL